MVMANGQGVILSLDDLAAWMKADAGRSWTVWHFGDDYERAAGIRAALPAGWTLAPTGEALNQAARRLEDDLINLDAHLLADGDDRTRWDASDLADRAPYVSSFGLDLCRAAVMAEAVQAGGDHLFVVEHTGLALALWRAAHDSGLSIGWRRPGGRPGWRDWCDRIRPALRAIRQAVRDQLRAVRDGITNLATLRALRRVRPLPVAELRSCDVLILTWAGDKTFPAGDLIPSSLDFDPRLDGARDCASRPVARHKSGHVSGLMHDGIKRRDMYLGPLPDLLHAAGCKVGYIARPLFWMVPFKAIAAGCAAAADPVMMIEDGLTARDLLAAALFSLRWPVSRGRRLRLDGLDLTALVRREAWIDRGKSRSGQAWLCLHIGRTLRRMGIRPKVVVMPYEGQPWEKLVWAGLRQHCPDTRVIGCQVSMFAAPYLGFYPSRQDVALGRIPDRLWCAGEHYATLFCRHGLPAERLSVVGALRYQSFLDQLNAPIAVAASCGQVTAVARPGGDGRLTVLCTTSIEYQESLELVHKTALAMAALGYGRLLVNFHPAIDGVLRRRLQDAIAGLLGGAPEGLIYADGSAQALLAQASVVVYNTSGSAFEALAAGVPVIYVGRDLAIDQDKIPDAVAVRCRSAEELRVRLAALAAGIEPQPSPERVGEMVASCLAPVRPEVIAAGVTQ